jgi:hypothetical protein
MTAAAVPGTDGVVSQHWRRTVYFRQGRFFVVSVTVRTPAYLPLRSAFPREYTTGRFTVREELQWLGLQDKKAQDAAGFCMPGSCLGSSTVLNLAAACNPAGQLQVQQGVQAGSACSKVHLSGRQHDQLLQERNCKRSLVQQQQAADADQQAQPWWSWLFSAARYVCSCTRSARVSQSKEYCSASCMQMASPSCPFSSTCNSP